MSNPATGLAGDEVLSVLEAAFRAGLLEIKRIRAAKEPEPCQHAPNQGARTPLSPAPAMPLTYLPKLPDPCTSRKFWSSWNNAVCPRPGTAWFPR